MTPLVVFTLLLPAFAANPDCENKFKATQMMLHPEDARIMCESSPSLATQDCLVELLTKTKGKLRGKDLFEVFGICLADSSPELKDCMVKGLDKAWNDAAYRGALKVGNVCMRTLAEQRLKAVRDSAATESANTNAPAPSTPQNRSK